MFWYIKPGTRWFKPIAIQSEELAVSYAELDPNFNVFEAELTAAEDSGLKPPAEWCALLDARIMDPDGWRYDGKSWETPISREEFDERMAKCTIDFRGYFPGKDKLQGVIEERNQS